MVARRAPRYHTRRLPRHSGVPIHPGCRIVTRRAWPASPTPSDDGGPMRVVVPPVLVRDRLCRIVAPVESLLEVEEWVGEWWEPSVVTLSAVSTAAAATDAQLAARVSGLRAVQAHYASVTAPIPHAR